jgi:hypothetical protein
MLSRVGGIHVKRVVHCIVHYLFLIELSLPRSWRRRGRAIRYPIIRDPPDVTNRLSKQFHGVVIVCGVAVHRYINVG